MNKKKNYRPKLRVRGNSNSKNKVNKNQKLLKGKKS